jgi:hypothetical protein
MKEEVSPMPCFPWKIQMLSLVLCCTSLQLATPPGLAQTAPVTSKLYIQVLEGEGALNDVRSRDIREPIVQVEDENHKPIAGAVVIFTTPSSGASASFPNGLTSLQTVTTVEGKAIATGFKPNGIPGSYQIQVQANWNHLTTSAVINQTNTKPSSTSTQTVHASRAFPLKAVLIVATVAAAGAVAAVLATRGGSSSGTITAGTPTVGPPPTAGIRFPRQGARN